MRHCTPDELIDVIDGVRDEQSLPHLAECASCRDELREARQALASVLEVGPPEPPPFALDQLSARIRTALAADVVSRRPGRWRAAPLGTLAAIAAAVLLAVVVWPSRAPAPAPPVSRNAVVPPAIPASAIEPAASLDAGPDDPSMVWMMELADGLADGLNDDAWSLADGVSTGATAGVVDALSSEQQQELARLIKEAMGSSGA